MCLLLQQYFLPDETLSTIFPGYFYKSVLHCIPCYDEAVVCMYLFKVERTTQSFQVDIVQTVNGLLCFTVALHFLYISKVRVSGLDLELFIKQYVQTNHPVAKT